MATVFTFYQMAKDIKANGLRAKDMVRENKLKKMVPLMKVILLKVKNLVKESLNIPMEASMRETLLMTGKKVMAFTFY